MRSRDLGHISFRLPADVMTRPPTRFCLVHVIHRTRACESCVMGRTQGGTVIAYDDAE